MGAWLGEAYQVADDIRDVVADPQLLGKPVAATRRWAVPVRPSNWASVAPFPLPRLIANAMRIDPRLPRCGQRCVRWWAWNPSAWCRWP
jgi:hypothetical protein